MCMENNVVMEGDEDEDDIISNEHADFGSNVQPTDPTTSSGQRRNRELIAAEQIRNRIIQNYF